MSIKALTGAAMLETLWAANHKDILDLVTPFVYMGIAEHTATGDVIDITKTANYVKENFGYKDFPEAVVTKILKRNKKKFFKRFRHKFILVSSLDDEIVQMQQREQKCEKAIDELGETLADYFNCHCKRTRRKYNKDEAIMYLQGFFDCYGDALISDEVRQRNLSSKTDKENYFIARFITENESSLERTYMLELVKGNFLQNALYLQGENSNLVTAYYKNSVFYYDTPFILNLLGYHSKHEQELATELHIGLKRQGASFAYFEHTKEEIDKILSAYQSSLIGHNNDSGRTLEGLDDRHYGFEGIERLKHTYPTRLSDEFGIILKANTSSGSTNVKSANLSNIIDETNLKEVIKNQVHYDKDSTLQYDIDSALAIHRIRDGNESVNIENCKAVFVTTNVSFANAFNQYYLKNVKINVFPPIISDVDLSAIVWIKSGTVDNDIPKIQLLKNAYSTIQPSNQVMLTYQRVLEQMKSEGKITEEQMYVYRQNRFMSNQIMEITKGNCDDIDEELITNLQCKYENEIRQEQRREYEDRQKGREKELYDNAIQKALVYAQKRKEQFLKINKIALRIISFIFALAFLIVVISTWGKAVFTVVFVIFFLVSCLNIYDLIRPREGLLEVWLEKKANQFENFIFERKKKEYTEVYTGEIK